MRELGIGIDFGTTYSCMACLDEAGRAQVIRNAEGEEKTPSLIFFGEGETLVGTPALHRLQDPGEPDDAFRVVRSIKRHLIHPPMVSLPGGRTVRPVEVVAEILRKLRRDAEEWHFHEPVTQAVLTVPAGFDEAQRDVLRDAAARVGFTQVELIEEPVAAALAFSRHDRIGRQGVLVYDLGGGTFDLAFATRQDDGSYSIVLQPDGDAHCGGDDFDQALYDHCDELARRQLNRSVSPAPGTLYPPFLQDCRRRKENLSHSEKETFSSFLQNGALFRHLIDRSTFEGLIRGTVEKTVRRTVQMAGRARGLGHTVDAVVLVGGSSRIPLVRRLLEEALAVPILNWSSQDVAVALGAAYAGEKPEPPSPLPAPPDPAQEKGRRSQGKTTARSVQIFVDCPNPVCSTDLALEDWGEVECEECGARFDVDRAGNVITSLSISCPRASCLEVTEQAFWGKTSCSTCEASFEVDVEGEVVTGLSVSCPNPDCSENLTFDYWGKVECDDCDVHFEIDEHGEVITNFSISCPNPSCPQIIEVSFWGRACCPECEAGFDMDEDGDIATDLSIPCPNESCPEVIEQSFWGKTSCEACEAGFEVDEEGDVITDLSVQCPNPDCSECVTSACWGKVACEECEAQFEIDEAGNVVSEIGVVCPKCSRSLRKLYWGVVSCKSCKVFFHVDDDGDVDVTVEVECPKCEEDLELDYWGLVTCPDCHKRFEIDADGDLV